METNHYYIELAIHDRPPDEWYINEAKRQLARTLADKIVSGELQGCYIDGEIRSKILYDIGMDMRICRVYMEYSAGKREVVYIRPMSTIEEITHSIKRIVRALIPKK